MVALTLNPADGGLYGVQHGRDRLHQSWPETFSAEDGAEKPSEEFFRILEGRDYGWPYCYHDGELGHKVLAPEYGGDGRSRGRSAAAHEPILAFPGYWAPNAVLFHSGRGFPARYAGGAFVAFHESWNRAPLEQAGYKVVFAPFSGVDPTGEYDVFADGFAGEVVQPGEARHRPTGLAEGGDGSLYISDSREGKVWRVVHGGM